MAAALAPWLPGRALVLGIDLLYPRQEPELSRLSEFCPPHGTAVDIGAWYGPWTRRLARRTDHVVALEPVPEVCAVLRSSVPRDVEVTCAAASDRTGEGTLWLLDGPRREIRGLSSLQPGALPRRRSVDVPLVRVDGLGLTGVSFVKIDVEGHEVAVLHGAERILRRDRPNLLVEVESRIQPVEHVVDLLDSWGYRGWVLPGPAWQPLDGFDLTAHQRATEGAVRRGLVLRSVSSLPRHVSSVLFTPQEGPGPAGLPG